MSISDQLAALFQQNGYVRYQKVDRIANEGSVCYKKGDEIRFEAKTLEELESIRQLLIAADFKPGKTYVQGKQFRQPIYGRQEVRRFLSMIKTAQDRQLRNNPKIIKPSGRFFI